MAKKNTEQDKPFNTFIRGMDFRAWYIAPRHVIDDQVGKELASGDTSAHLLRYLLACAFSVLNQELVTELVHNNLTDRAASSLFDRLTSRDMLDLFTEDDFRDYVTCISGLHHEILTTPTRLFSKNKNARERLLACLGGVVRELDVYYTTERLDRERDFVPARDYLYYGIHIRRDMDLSIIRNDVPTSLHHAVNVYEELLTVVETIHGDVHESRAVLVRILRQVREVVNLEKGEPRVLRVNDVLLADVLNEIEACRD